MRLIKFLNESFEDIKIEDPNIIADMIISECAPFLNMMKASNKVFCRNMKYGTEIMLIHQEKFRKPKDSNVLLHNISNEFFEKKFGWPCRNGTFCYGFKIFITSINLYGEPYIIFGVGNNFEYVYSNKIQDYYDISKVWFQKEMFPDLKKDDYLSLRISDDIEKNIEKVKNIVEMFVDEYKNKDIQNVRPVAEISFNFPNGYYALETRSTLSQQIIKIIYKKYNMR